MNKPKLRKERRQEWKDNKKNFSSKEEWRKSWEKFKI